MYLEKPIEQVRKSKERFRRKQKLRNKKKLSGKKNHKLAQFHTDFQEEL